MTSKTNTAKALYTPLPHRKPATMLPADLTILILLVSGLVFAIIELGLSAYIVSAADSYISYVGYGVVPGWLAFLLFASLWTVIRTLFRLVRLVRRAKPSYDASGRPSTQKWVPILTLVINAITMIFWLSGFAAYATWLSGFAPIGIYGALLAFAVMLVSFTVT